MKDHSHRAGFTLIELMLVVAIIGVLAAIAIPSFVNYQLKSKRSEAFSNLQAIATAQNSYFAANGVFVDTGTSFPGMVGPNKRLWDAPSATAFDPFGFRPEGNVYLDYAVTTAGPCTCVTCFTASAYGDIDGDGMTSVLLYVHPDNVGGSCNDQVLGYGTPIDMTTMNPIFDGPAWNSLSDDF